jgi:D-tyrosyl-tRNA(Tyr) deacylase
MIALIQRVSRAEVRVDERIVGAIGQGIAALIGVRRADNEADAERLLERLLGYRIFSDAQDRMNVDVRAVNGGLLLVPQFTLAADTARGMRPGFSTAAPPEEARRLFDYLVTKALEAYPRVAQGEFGAHMQLSLINDGPVTFWLET